MTLDIYVFIALAALAVIASIFIFLQKRLIHAVLFLAIVFVSSSIIFLLLGQTLIAVLQMLIFVGGLSTYLIVAVATEEKGANLISIKWLQPRFHSRYAVRATLPGIPDADRLYNILHSNARRI